MNQDGIQLYFKQHGTKIFVERESSICNPKLSDNYVYYLADGIASLTSLTDDGTEKDFLYFPAGHLLGFVPALMRHYRKIRKEKPADASLHMTPFGIDTKTDCIFYRISEPVFEGLLDRDPIFLSYVMEATTRNYASLVTKFHDTQACLLYTSYFICYFNIYYWNGFGSAVGNAHRSIDSSVFGRGCTRTAG